MSAAAAQSKMVTSDDEFPSGLDLNLSLNSTSPSLEIQAELPQLERVVVDLTKPPTSEGGSQNSTVSTLTRKRTHPEEDEEEEPRSVPGREASPRGGSDEEDAENSRKKLRLTTAQSLLLEETFKDHKTLNPRQKQALAKQLGLSARQVEVWFQNRRARTKLKQTEAECEFMKRNCENLMDRVRRLQKEVNDLRALKLAPQIYMQMPPAATLTLCPSCQRVGIPTQTTGPDISSRVGPGSGNPWADLDQLSSHRPF